MTLFQSVVNAPCGSRHSLLVQSRHSNDFIWGEEIPTGQSVFFQIEGDLETDFVTLYDVLRGPQIDDGSIRLLLDEKSTWYPSNHPPNKGSWICSRRLFWHRWISHCFFVFGGKHNLLGRFLTFGLLCVSPCVWTWSMC